MNKWNNFKMGTLWGLAAILGLAAVPFAVLFFGLAMLWGALYVLQFLL